MTEEQAVVEETNAPAKPAAEEPVAQDKTAEDFLKEFEEELDKETAETELEKPKDDQSKIDWLVEREEERQKAETRETTRSTVNEAVDVIKKDLGLEIPDRMIRGDLYARAEDDPRFLNAFANRHKNPSAWSGVLSSVAKELRTEFESRPDENATADRNAVRNAVRSITGAPQQPASPSNADLEKMSDHQFAEYKRGLG